MVIPEVYAIGTTTEAESAYKGVETGGGISYDAAYDKGDYVVAVGAGHGEFFRKPTSPPLPLREGPPLISVFSPQGRRGNRPFNSLYDPFGSPYRGQKRCSNRFAIWLADHQRSTPAAELRFFVRDKPQGHTMLDACSMLMEPQGHTNRCLMLIARNLLGLLLMGTQGHE